MPFSIMSKRSAKFERGEHRHADAEQDSDGVGLVEECDRAAEDVDDEGQEVERHHAQRGEHHDLAEPLGDLDDPRSVEEQHHEEHAERRPDRLDDDAVLERLVRLGDRTDRESLGDRVRRGEELGQVRLEHQGEHDADADDDAEHGERRELDLDLAVRSTRVSSTASHPAVAEASISRTNTDVAVITPWSVIAPFQVDTGPSLAGTPGTDGGAQT